MAVHANVNTSGLVPFKKGQSGNPKGRPKGAGAMRHVAAQFGPKALAVLWEIASTGKDERARVLAAEKLLDRGYGKPMTEAEIVAQYGQLPQAVLLEGEESEQLLAIRFVHADKPLNADLMLTPDKSQLK